MPLPSSLQAYGDCLDFFETIADDSKGGRLYLGSYDKAHKFRLRCNKARQLHREENKKIHDESTKLWGASEYDPFQLTLKQDTEGAWYIYAIRMTIDPDEIELLSEMEPEDGDKTQSA